MVTGPLCFSLPSHGLVARTSFGSGYVKQICCVSVTCHSKIRHLALLIKPYPIWSNPHHHHPTTTHSQAPQLCFPFKYHVPLKYLGNRKCVSCLPWVRSCCNLLLQYHLPITDFSSALSVYSLSHLKAPIASFDLMLSTMIISEG